MIASLRRSSARCSGVGSGPGGTGGVGGSGPGPGGSGSGPGGKGPGGLGGGEGAACAPPDPAPMATAPTTMERPKAMRRESTRSTPLERPRSEVEIVRVVVAPEPAGRVAVPDHRDTEGARDQPLAL